MERSSRGRMTALLKTLCLMLLAGSCFFLFSILAGVAALIGVEADSEVVLFLATQCVSGVLAVIPLLAFVRLVSAVILSQELFSRVQSRRMLLIAVCFLLRVVVDLLTPRIEVPHMLDGAIGSMSLGPSLNLTTLAISLMFFALAGVFEYGRKLQEDSDNIL